MAYFQYLLNINKLMNRLFVLFIFILISFTISADEIEILSDIPGNGPEIKFHYKIIYNLLNIMNLYYLFFHKS